MSNTILLPDTLDISTRPKRRKAVSSIVFNLSRIRDEELAYMERIPLNFQEGEAYAAADSAVELLSDAIGLLEDAF
jgi:hypothetical protein